MYAPRWTTVQGKPVARRGRKARDLPRGDRPVAGGQRKRTMRWCREGEPGALHRGPVASGDHGPDTRRGNQVAADGLTSVRCRCHAAPPRPRPGRTGRDRRSEAQPTPGRLRPNGSSDQSGLRAAPSVRPAARAEALLRSADDMPPRPRTIVEKIWTDHVVIQEPGAPAVLAVDLHLVHEVTSPQAFSGLRARGLGVRRPGRPSPRPTTRSRRPTAACRSSTRWPPPRSTSSSPTAPSSGSRYTASATRARASSTSSARSSG